MGMMNSDEIIIAPNFAIYDAPMWLFGILTSLMHMAWVKTVGGRLETRYRYSAQLCYNTFPFPKISEAKKQEIEAAALNKQPTISAGTPPTNAADKTEQNKLRSYFGLPPIK